LVFPRTLSGGLAYRSNALVFKNFKAEEDAVKLSTKGRYAVMAMVDLARHAQAKPVSLSDIAARQEISLSYLEQLFARLRRAELVKSVRGPGGGYRLARTSAETRVSEIILAVDEPIKATRCTEMGQSGCRADRSKCLTHDLWEELGNQIHVFLSSVSLHDVLERKLAPRIAEAPPTPANSDTMAAAS
jgi:Rrf2 family transcriptional regulator, iron-sulfur cluster assembly transcription factor